MKKPEIKSAGGFMFVDREEALAYNAEGIKRLTKCFETASQRPEDDGLLQHILDRIEALEEQLAIMKAPTPSRELEPICPEPFSHLTLEEYNQSFTERFFGEKK